MSERDEDWTPPDPAIRLDEYGITMPKWMAWLIGSVILGFIALLAFGLSVTIAERVDEGNRYDSFVESCEADGNFVINIERHSAECVNEDRQIQEVWHS